MSLDHFLKKPPKPLQDSSTEESSLQVTTVENNVSEPITLSSDEIPVISPKLEVKKGLGVDVASSSRKSFLSLFSRNKKEIPRTDSSENSSIEEVPAEAKASINRRATKKDKSANPLSMLNKKSSSKKSNDSKKSCFVVTELDGAKVMYWEVTSSGLSQIVEPNILDTYASFSKLDNSYYTELPLTRRQATDFVLSELAEDSRVINDSKEGFVYATSSIRVSEYPFHMGPGVQLINKLIALKSDKSVTNAIFVLRLENKEDGTSVAVLVHRAKDGTVSPPQIALNSNNIEFTLSQFASNRRIGDEYVVEFFDNDDLLSVFSQLSVYPNDSYILGLVPVAQAKVGLAVISGILALGLSAHSALTYSEYTSYSAKKVSIESTVRSLKQNISNNISSDLLDFAKSQSLDFNQVSNRAIDIWTPYSKVIVNAKVGYESYSVSMPISPDATSTGRNSMLRTLMNEDLSIFILKQPPNECSKTSLGISGAIDAIQFEITCQSPDRPIYRYRID